MLRPDISRLNKNRSIHLKIGFFLSLSFVIMAFNWTVYEDPSPQEEAVYVIDDPDLIIVPNTYQNPPKPPPPLLETTTEIVEIEQEFIEESLPEKIERVIEVPKEMKVIRVAPKVKAPPTPAPVIPQPELPEEPKIEAPMLVVEEMPRFPGCEEGEMNKEDRKKCAEKELMSYIYGKIKYPAMALSTDIEGTVVLSYIVEKDGSITDLEILKDIGGGCGREVTRIVRDMPNWIPGKQRGRPVRVRFRLPVKFTIKH